MDLNNRETGNSKPLPRIDRLTPPNLKAYRDIGIKIIHSAKDHESALVGAMVVRLCAEIEELTVERDIAKLDLQSCETRLRNQR